MLEYNMVKRRSKKKQRGGYLRYLSNLITGLNIRLAGLLPTDVNKNEVPIQLNSEEDYINTISYIFNTLFRGIEFHIKPINSANLDRLSSCFLSTYKSRFIETTIRDRTPKAYPLTRLYDYIVYIIDNSVEYINQSIMEDMDYFNKYEVILIRRISSFNGFDSDNMDDLTDIMIDIISYFMMYILQYNAEMDRICSNRTGSDCNEPCIRKRTKCEYNKSIC